MKNKISNFEIGTLNYFISRAFLIGVTFTSLISILKQDSWIIPLISLIPGIIFIMIINTIMSFEPELNISQKITKLFSKPSSVILIIFISIVGFLMCTLNHLNVINFIHSQFLNNTPILVISIIFISGSIYILNKGLTVLTRSSVILFYIGFIFFLISLFGLFSSFELSNLKPMFQSSPENYLRGLIHYYSLNISPIFILTSIPKDSIKTPYLKKTLIISYIVGAITLFFVVFSTLATFGYELTSLYKYPEFHVLKNISILGLSARIESILVIQWFFDLFICNTLLLYFIGSNIKVINKKINIKIVYFISCVLIIILSILLSKYNIFLDKFILNYLPLPTLIITLFVNLLIFIKIKTKKSIKMTDSL